MRSKRVEEGGHLLVILNFTHSAALPLLEGLLGSGIHLLGLSESGFHLLDFFFEILLVRFLCRELVEHVLHAPHSGDLLDLGESFVQCRHFPLTLFVGTLQSLGLLFFLFQLKAEESGHHFTAMEGVNSPVS
jgi:hypothetical protein